MSIKEQLLGIRQYILELSRINPNYAIYEIFQHSNKEECISLINEINEINEKLKSEKNRSEKGKLTLRKGKALETLAKATLNVDNIYDTFENIGCDSNEIDILAIPGSSVWEYKALLPDFMIEKIIVECKNYNKKIDVTWTGKLYSLIKYKNVKSAILFSYYPLTGANEWEDAKGLVKKIYLKDGISIINITLDEINSIMRDKKEIQEDKTNKYSNIVMLIKSKVNELQFHVDFSKLITTHPAEKNN